VALAAGDLGHRGARQHEPGMVAVAHHEDFDPRRSVGDRIEVRIAAPRRDDGGNDQQYEETEKERAEPFGGPAHHTNSASAPLSKFVIHCSTDLTRTSKAKGH